MKHPLPRIIADGPLDATVLRLLEGNVELCPWTMLENGAGAEAIAGIYTFGHPTLNGAMLDRVSGVRVISNYGVGVDHIVVADAAARGIPVGNTPGILNGATADMGFALLLAAARRVVEGDRYARSSKFTSYDPSYMLGQEVHGRRLGIVGMGRIGEQVARRGMGFDMRVCYHNRRRRPELESELEAEFLTLHELLETSDFVMLCVPLTNETTGLIGADELQRMKPTAILINIARGGVVNTAALTHALRERSIYAAALDVTDPEPLPRNAPLLQLDNVVIAPHLGSATQQTRQRMAEISVENLLLGLRGEPLLHRVETN